MIYVFLAKGFEIVEAMAPVDILRRARFEVTTVGVGSKVVESSCGIKVTADAEETELAYDDMVAIVLPGGMPGTLNLEKSEIVQGVIDKAVEENALITAICAAPSILGHKGLLEGREAVCYPGFEVSLLGADISSESIVCDGNFITAKGAGVAVDFGLKIVETLDDKETADSIKSSIQCK